MSVQGVSAGGVFSGGCLLTGDGAGWYLPREVFVQVVLVQGVRPEGVYHISPTHVHAGIHTLYPFHAWIHTLPVDIQTSVKKSPSYNYCCGL